MKRAIILLSLIFACFNVNAVTVSTVKGNIQKLYTYDDFGAVAGRDGTDVAVLFNTGLTECPEGVWLTPAAPGYKTLVSFLLTAYTTSSSVLFQVYNDRIWTGSTVRKFCQIDAVRF